MPEGLSLPALEGESAMPLEKGFGSSSNGLAAVTIAVTVAVGVAVTV